MNPRVYVETSVISYLTARPSRDLITAAQQIMTQQWWAGAGVYELYASQLTIDEASRGDVDAAERRLAVLRSMSILTLDESARQLGETLVQRLAIPPKAIDDAYHVAIAAVNGMDYLVTWNCTHIANLQMRALIEEVCRAAGFQPAVIGTPQELFADGDE